MTEPKVEQSDSVESVVLLPCPFCGSSAEWQPSFDIDCESSTIAIMCSGCMAMVGPFYPDNVEDQMQAADAWNKRHSPG